MFFALSKIGYLLVQPLSQIAWLLLEVLRLPATGFAGFDGVIVLTVFTGRI